MSIAWYEAESRSQSRRRCPECKEKMVEVHMPEFGPRWQCEDCRLTVFLTGGIQPWRHARDVAAS